MIRSRSAMVSMMVIVCFAALVAVAPETLAYRGKRSVSVIVRTSTDVASELAYRGAALKGFVEMIFDRISDVKEYAIDSFSIKPRSRE